MEAMRGVRWGPNEDTILLNLFQKGPREGGVDYRDRTKENINQVHAAHFPNRSIKSFAQVFRRKAKTFETERNLEGHRRRAQIPEDLLKPEVIEKEPEENLKSDSPEPDSSDSDTEEGEFLFCIVFPKMSFI